MKREVAPHEERKRHDKAGFASWHKNGFIGLFGHLSLLSLNMRVSPEPVNG